MGIEVAYNQRFTGDRNDCGGNVHTLAGVRADRGGIHVGELDPFTFGELNFESHHLGGIFGDVADTFEDEGVLDVGEEATTSKQGLSVISQCGISRDARCLVA